MLLVSAGLTLLKAMALQLSGLPKLGGGGSVGSGWRIWETRRGNRIFCFRCCLEDPIL